MVKKRSQKISLLKSKNLIYFLIFVLAFIIIISTGTVNAATTYECTNCSNCTAVIVATSSGDIVQLNQSILNYNIQNGACIHFNGTDDITFDCQNNNIDSGAVVAGASAIYLNLTDGGSNNNTIKNCNLTDFAYGYGVIFNSGSNNTLTNIISTKSAILLNYSSNHNLSNISVSGVNGPGISLTKVNDSILTNIILDSNLEGIRFSTGSNNTFQDIITTNSTNSNGIGIQWASNNTFQNITATLNNIGIHIATDSANSNNTFRNNNMSNNTINFKIGVTPNSLISHYQDIDTSNIVDYSYKLYYNYSASDYVFDSTTAPEAGAVFCIACDNVTYKDLNLSHNNENGLFFLQTNNSHVENVTTDRNNIGVYISYSSNDTFQDITSNSNDYTGFALMFSSNNILQNVISNLNAERGIDIFGSSNNTFQNITADSNPKIGVRFILTSNNNTINNSNITNNTEKGIYFHTSEYNVLYNNFFNNTLNYYNVTNLTNYFNTTQTEGANILGESYIGGNYWAYPNGTGFSENCTDSDSDGICDSSYNVDGVNQSYDYLPLTYGGAAPSCTESWTCGSWSVCSGGTQTRTCTDSNSCGTTTSRPALSQTCTVSENGGGGEVTKDQPTETHTWTEIPAGEPTEMIITDPEIDLTTITITTTKTLTDVSVTVKEVGSSKKADFAIELPTGEIYEAFDIITKKIKDKDIANITIGFKVNKTWVEEQNASVENISLYRKEKKTWTELETILTGSDSDYYYFSAISSGFSIFVVVIDLSACNNNDVCESELGEDEANCPNDCKVIFGQKGFFETIKSYLWTGIIFVLVIAIVLVVLITRLKKRKTK